MGSSSSSRTAPAPPPPTPVDPLKSSLDFTRAMADPALQGQILASEQEFRPQYNQLELNDINQMMQGSGGQMGLLGLQDLAAQQVGATERSIYSQQREADIADVENLGGRASEAFLNANPQLRAQLDQANQLGQSQDFFGGLEGMMGGEFGQGLYNQGMGQLEAGAGESAIGAAGLDFMGRGGNLTPLQARNASQAARAGGLARGREMGQGALYDEAMARLAQEMQVEQQNVGMGAGLLGQEFGMQQQRLGMAGGMYGQATGNEAMLGQLRQGQLGADRAYALQQSQMLAGVASDPFQAILGRPSNAAGMGMQGAQFGAGLAGQPMGPNLFDPNAGINLALQNNANLSNYNANIHGSNAALSGARAQASGAKSGAMMGAGGAIAAAAVPALIAF